MNSIPFPLLKHNLFFDLKMKCFVIFAFLVALTLAQDQCSIPDNEKIDCLPKVGGNSHFLCSYSSRRPQVLV